MRGLPLAVEDPNPYDELPSEEDRWSNSIGKTIVLETSLHVNTLTKLAILVTRCKLAVYTIEWSKS
jgi:hypothetical protein